MDGKRIVIHQRLVPALAGVLAASVFLACGYTPHTTDGQVIYREACASCHAVPPAIGPNLVGMRLTPEVLSKKLDAGGKGMPKFPGIKGEARQNLIKFVLDMKSPSGD
jgi:mono/diheme cytochrome c family protein